MSRACLRLVLQRRQVGTEYFDGQRALQPGFGFIHGVLGGLGVIENDAGKHLQFLLHRLDQLRLGVNRPAPRLVVVRFQPHVELVVEKPGRVRGIVGTPQLVGHRGHLRKAQQDVADLGRKLGRFLERDGVGRGGAHPQRAFIEVRHEFRADIRNQHQGGAEDHQDQGHRDQPVAQAPSESLAVQVPADPFEDRHLGFVHVLAQEKGAQHGQQGQSAQQRAEQRERHGVGHGLEQPPRRPRQNVDRDVSGDDHRDGVEDGTLDVVRRRPDDVQQVVSLAVARRQLPEDVLHHHHRAIHDDSEINGADRQQVGRDMPPVQADE